MVAPAKVETNGFQCVRRVVLSEIHGHLPGRHNLLFAGLVLQQFHRNFEISGYGFLNKVEVDLGLHFFDNVAQSLLHHFQVDIAAAQAALSYQRGDDALQLTHVGMHRVGEVVHHIVWRNVNTVLLHLVANDGHPRLKIRALHISRQAPFEPI